MTQAENILAALGDGVMTSGEISARLGADRRRISVALCGLADAGQIERAGVANLGDAGRPFVRWRLRSAQAARPQSRFRARQ